MASATAQDDRVSVFLRKAEISPPPKIPRLAKLADLDFQPSQEDLNTARHMLAEQRKSGPGYKNPEEQKRHRLRSGKRKEEKSNVDKWVFSKHEVGKALNVLLHRTPLGPFQTAQALLSYISKTTMTELWCHVHDQKLEKKMSRTFFARRSSSLEIPPLPWLDLVTKQEHIDYIRLLYQAGVEQEELDRAFGVALSQNSMETMKTLLNLGSVASSYRDAIKTRIDSDNIELATLLLSAPHAMSVDAWRLCIKDEVLKRSSTIFSVCLAHRPDIVCGSLLVQSLAAQNLGTTTIILAYASSDEVFSDVRPRACELTSNVQDDELRFRLFQLLSMSGFVADSPVLREELLKDVKTRQLELVRLFTEAGVSLDIEPHAAAYFAVSCMDFDILELFRNGTFSLPVSLALNFAPGSASETDMLQLLSTLGPLGIAGDPLNIHLIRAVRRKELRLIKEILQYGASIEFQNAASVQVALELADFTIASMLLTSQCSPEILSTVIPTAMELKPWSTRLKAMEYLTEKGILPQKLGIPLQNVVSQDGEVDIGLIHLLLKHGAPLDGAGDVNRNVILVATRRGLLPVLKLLCDAGPQKDTVSNAVPIAFSAIHAHGYHLSLGMAKLLIEKGAAGHPVHQTLLAAAKQDPNLDFVRLLIEHNADANYGFGACFVVAIENTNFELLEILCAGCPPSPANTKSILFTAIDPRYFMLPTLELLLRSTPTVDAVLNASWASEKLRGNPNLTQIVPCFLRYGMNVDLGNGTLLCFAIKEEDLVLFSQILYANPSIASLAIAFREITSNQQRSFQLEGMALLLEKSESAEIGQSGALWQETKHAMANDFRGFDLLIRHKADVNYDNGKALQAASAAGSRHVLAPLLSLRPNLDTIQHACLATTSSSAITSDNKRQVLENILDTNGGLPIGDLSKILAKSVMSLPECTQLPELLIFRGAEVGFESLKIALKTSSQPLFMALANSTFSSSTILNLFRYAREASVNSDRQYWVYEYLLSRGVTKEEISEALLASLKPRPLSDLAVSKLLLEYGASVDYKDGVAITLALDSRLFEAVFLLSQYFVDDRTANLAFKIARKATAIDLDMRFEAYQCFLQWQINKSSIYDALLENLQGNQPDVAIVELLLEQGADPHKDEARCFVVASSKKLEAEFRALSRCGNTDLQLVLRSLLNHFKEEWEVVWWFGRCLEEQFESIDMGQENLLFQCLRKFPHGTTLLKLLLDKGIPSSAKVTTRLCPDWQPEICTALIWALFSSKPRIGNEPILALLSHGKNAALPAFSTPINKVSAAFACILDNTRTDVLKALINLDRKQVMEHTMRESKFCYLAAYPKVSKQDLGVLDDANELSPRVASVYTGNFEAFILMKFEDVVDDGMLHLTAMSALPKFVEWLVAKGHDPNCKVPEYGPYIPLAMVCSSTLHPWCKIANKESDLLTRQKQTMMILGTKTKLDWKYSGQTVLHIAFEGGYNVTKAMVEVLNLRNDVEKDKRYQYVDKDGIHFSPEQYVIRLMKVGRDEKIALLKILKDCMLMSRYYKAVEPLKGTQPEGYHGLPKRLQDAWDQHELQSDLPEDDWESEEFESPPTSPR